MTLAASLFLLVQATAGTVAVPPDASPSGSTINRSSSGQAVASATVGARVLRPVSVRVKGAGGSVEIESQSASAPQTKRDAKGTLWIEFN